MLTYLVYFLGIEGSPYFAAFLVGILGVILGRYLKLSICAVVSMVTFLVSLYMIATFEEMAILFGFADLFFSIVLSVSMWVTALVTSRNNPGFKDFVQTIKTSILR